MVGSPLAPIVANYCVENLEKHALSMTSKRLPY